MRADDIYTPAVHSRDISVTPYYFAYGMNTDPEQMSMRTGTPEAVGRGLVRDHAFRFAVHADVYPSPGKIAHGVLWRLDDRQLAALDVREGFPFYYDRKVVEVESGGRVYRAWMYYMTPGHTDSPPSEHYYSMLQRGYTHFHVPQAQIVAALTRSQAGGRQYQPRKPEGRRRPRWWPEATTGTRYYPRSKRRDEGKYVAGARSQDTDEAIERFIRRRSLKRF